jgi:hypothetical protein
MNLSKKSRKNIYKEIEILIFRMLDQIMIKELINKVLIYKNLRNKNLSNNNLNLPDIHQEFNKKMK